jgi:hypothetical protein
MKPNEQKSQSLKQARGLARWGWIKRYLAPTLNSVGITSDDFDTIFLGKDQVVRQKNETISIFPRPTISINGDFYTPTGDDVPASNKQDGYWYIEWEWFPNTEAFELDATLPIYQWGGGYTFITPPRFSFKANEAEQEYVGLLDTSIPDSVYSGWSRILVATRQNGTVEVYGDPSIINVILRGFTTIMVGIL